MEVYAGGCFEMLYPAGLAGGNGGCADVLEGAIWRNQKEHCGLDRIRGIDKKNELPGIEMD
jgi:hypothetical protein